MYRFVLAIIAVTTTCVIGCGENPHEVYRIVERRRENLSQNVVVGRDFFGKAKIVCQCDSEGVRDLFSKSILASKRDKIVRVKRKLLKYQPQKRQTELNDWETFSKNERERSERDVIYAPTCCKIDLANPGKLYRYPFTFRLPDETYTKELADPRSQKYQRLQKQLTSGLTILLANEECVVKIDVTKFREGSVLADITLSVQGMITQSVVDTLKCALDSGNIGGLAVEIVPEIPPNGTSSINSSPSSVKSSLTTRLVTTPTTKVSATSFSSTSKTSSISITQTTLRSFSTLTTVTTTLLPSSTQKVITPTIVFTPTVKIITATVIPSTSRITPSSTVTTTAI